MKHLLLFFFIILNASSYAQKTSDEALSFLIDKKYFFETTSDDSLFAVTNSDWAYRILSRTPEANDSLYNASPGKVFGPYLSHSFAVLYKVKGFDSCYMVRASHILFSVKTDYKDGKYNKADAKKTAELVLKKIKAGASYQDMAKQYGCDDTAPRGGDLGWFKEKVMVPEFSDACFNAKKGDLFILETDFGFHIILINEEKTRKKCGVLVLPLVKNFSLKK